MAETSSKGNPNIVGRERPKRLLSRQLAKADLVMYAGLVELVYTTVSKTVGFGREGSNPSFCT
jgi:hypothetical protein